MHPSRHSPPAPRTGLSADISFRLARGRAGARGGPDLITLTRLNNKSFVVNVEMIKTIEETPDTTLSLLGGDHLMVRESLQEVVDKAIDYARQVRSFRVI